MHNLNRILLDPLHNQNDNNKIKDIFNNNKKLNGLVCVTTNTFNVENNVEYLTRHWTFHDNDFNFYLIVEYANEKLKFKSPYRTEKEFRNGILEMCKTCNVEEWAEECINKIL